MSEGENPAEDLSPAERRLAEHLGLLRGGPSDAESDLLSGVLRRARWQRAIRDPVVLMGAVAVAVGDSLTLLFGPPGGH